MISNDVQQAKVLEIAKKEKVNFIQLQFMDLLGFVKTVTIPVTKLDSAMDDGVVFDGSSVTGYAEIEESDMRVRPDASTFRIFPWTSGDLKSAGIVCNVYDASGKRFSGDPRFVLEQATKKARDMGYVSYMGPEYEFFLFKIDQSNNPTTFPCDFGRYFEQLPMDSGEVVRKETILYLNEMGFEAEAAHHEVAPGQHEIDLRYTDAISSADRVLTLKHAIKTVALKHGLHASFMPKPIVDINGSGMHVHQSLMTPTGENVFFEPTSKWELSDLCRWYIGGILQFARETCAILSSWINSYKRLVPGYEAPVYISWANKNRSALIRVPAGRGQSARLEVRNPDSAGNPYLQYAVMLAAGLRGIEKKIEPPAPIETNIYALGAKEKTKLGIGCLPSSMDEALDELEKSELMRETLGAHIWTNYLYLKRQECDEYRLHVSDWELNKYLPIL